MDSNDNTEMPQRIIFQAAVQVKTYPNFSSFLIPLSSISLPLPSRVACVKGKQKFTGSTAFSFVQTLLQKLADMVLAFLTRPLILVLGYIYPAYDCYKTLELKVEIDQLQFWCQYWILIAILTVFERVADNFVSWLPMYSEAKLALIVYLWYPKTRGTTYVYDTFFRPYLSRHETQIDRHLLELHTRVSDVASLFFHRLASYGQSRVYEVLEYVASQSNTSSGSRNIRRRPQPQRSQPGTHMPSQQTNGTASGQLPPVASNVPPEQQTMHSEGGFTTRPQPIPQEGANQIPNSGEAVQVNGADVSNKETLMEGAMRAAAGRLRWRLAPDPGPSTSTT